MFNEITLFSFYFFEIKKSSIFATKKVMQNNSQKLLECEM